MIKTSTKQTEVKHLHSINYSILQSYSKIYRLLLYVFENVYIFIKNNLHTSIIWRKKISFTYELVHWKMCTVMHVTDFERIIIISLIVLHITNILTKVFIFFHYNFLLLSLFWGDFEIYIDPDRNVPHFFYRLALLFLTKKM